LASVYVCSHCRYQSEQYLSGCPSCGQGWFNREDAGAAALNPPADFDAARERRVCYKCDFETPREMDVCPRCGHKLITSARVKVLGWVLIVLGLFLVAFMGVITLLVAGIIAGAGRPGSTQSFSGGTKELALIFGIFALVIAFGLTCAVAGFSQARSGRRNKKLVKALLGVFFALIAAGTLIQIIL
jgi:RNA polymerase subunit RPABC4/transcription elongation factor Spt4